MCFHPISVPVYKLEPITSVKHDGCSTYTVRQLHRVKHYKQVPCGKCVQCLAEQQKQWAFRIENEALYGGHAACYFVTLTYAPDFLPEGNTLVKEHVKKYMHDLRQMIDLKYGPFDGPDDIRKPKVKYYFCGEYGSRKGRAHYHAILFFSRSIDWLLIQKAWSKGIVDILPFLPARAGYVAKYSMKQIGQMYDGKQPPFRLVSNGLGKCFIDGKTIESFHFNGYYRNLSGYRIKLPRYYMDKLLSERNRWRSVYEFAGNRVVSNRSRTIRKWQGVVYTQMAVNRFYKNDNLARAKFGTQGKSYDQWLIANQIQQESVYLNRNLQLNLIYNGN